MMGCEMQFSDVKAIIVDVLALDASSAEVLALNEQSGLMGDRPEFDSMAVVQLLVALEEFYGFEVEDDEIEADLFTTFGSLSDFVARKLKK